MKYKVFLKNICLIIYFVFSLIFMWSCSKNNDDLLFVLSKSSNNGNASIFIRDIENYYNKKIDSDKNFHHLKKRKIKLTISNDELLKKNLLENGTADFAFLKSQTIIEQKNLLNFFTPIVQTLTLPFIFDNNPNSYYQNGIDDELIQIANTMNKVSFDIGPFNEWFMNNNFKWDGVKYKNFYDYEAQKTELFRGMILICGDLEKTNLIKKYWNNKDWNNFRNMGLIVGENSSFGTYKLQEELIRKHFNLGKNFSLSFDKKINQNKYAVDKYGYELIGKSDNFSISFTDEGSFSWTKSYYNTSSFTALDKNNKITVLTVTDPMIYDIGIMSKRLSKEEQDLLSEAIINTNEINNYSIGLGYYGMRLIENFQIEVLNKYYKIFE